MKVQSSAISDLEYDAEAEILTIEFPHGGKYRYEQVPEHIFRQLVESSSIGRAFQQLVKAKYPATKVS